MPIIRSDGGVEFVGKTAGDSMFQLHDAKTKRRLGTLYRATTGSEWLVSTVDAQRGLPVSAMQAIVDFTLDGGRQG